MTAVTPPTQPLVNDTDSDRIASRPHLTHTTTNITLSPEQFERLYLAPKVPHASEHAARFANAVPLGFLGYVFLHQEHQ
jgi:hypothetical protein